VLWEEQTMFERQITRFTIKFVIVAVLLAFAAIAAFAGGFCSAHPAATCNAQREVMDGQGHLFTEYYCSCGDTVYVRH
jgi:hypothetical protein